MAKSKINERNLALKSGGNFTLLKDYFDKTKVVRGPFNETQTMTGLTASDGDVVVDTLIPINAAIGDNRTLSNGAYNTAANDGGIVCAAGTETTGFITAGTFVHDMVTVTDDYGNVLNGVQIRYEASHDPVTDTDGREVIGLLVRPFSLADDTAMGAAASENLEICFVVNDGTGTYAKAAGGVTGDIEFSVNRVFAERNIAKIYLAGGNAVDMDIPVDLETVHYSRYIMTTATTATGGNLTLLAGTWDLSGVSDYAGDGTHVTLPLEADFTANTCRCYINGVLQDKGSGLDVEFVSAGVVQVNTILDIGDEFAIERKY